MLMNLTVRNTFTILSGRVSPCGNRLGAAFGHPRHEMLPPRVSVPVCAVNAWHNLTGALGSATLKICLPPFSILHNSDLARNGMTDVRGIDQGGASIRPGMRQLGL